MLNRDIQEAVFTVSYFCQFALHFDLHTDGNLSYGMPTTSRSIFLMSISTMSNIYILSGLDMEIFHKNEF